jgi:mannan endo-1,4-beta-mannosidase
MRFSIAAISALLGLALAAPSPVGTDQGLSKRATITTTNGLLFNIDGKTAYFAGTNSYWIGFLTNNADVDLVMTQLAGAGLNVLRVWGFNDITSATSGVWYQSFIPGASPVINTGANGLQRLDYVVSSAEAHGIKLIINFVNNWSDYGGMPAYNTYYGTTKETWYTNTAVQTQYKAYIAAVVARYKTSTAIFAWELANEPRCNGCATSVITNWATTISAYIKSLDSSHLVTLGDEGFMNGGGDGSYPYTIGEGIDFQANLKISTLDFGTFHLYPSACKSNFPIALLHIIADKSDKGAKRTTGPTHGSPHMQQSAKLPAKFVSWRSTVQRMTTSQLSLHGRPPRCPSATTG